MTGKKGIFLQIDIDDQGTAKIKDFESQYKKAMENLKSSTEKANTQISSSYQKLRLAFTNLGGSVLSLKNIFAGFITYKVTQILFDMAKDAMFLSARYETLGVVLGVVGNNVGYARDEMDQFVRSVEKQGIALVEARLNVIRMAQADMDLTKATQLARIAQDAAVIGQMNSSDAFTHMIHGIQSGQTDILRTIGINVNFEASYKKLADQLGVTSKDLTEMQKVTARTNAVVEAGANIVGTYGAAMGTAGKQLTSMQRYVDNLKVRLGETFNEALVVGVNTLTYALKDANEEAQKLSEEKQLQEWGHNLVMILAFTADAANGVKMTFEALGKTIALTMQIAASAANISTYFTKNPKKILSDWVAGDTEGVKKEIQFLKDVLANGFEDIKDVIPDTTFQQEATKYFDSLKTGVQGVDKEWEKALTIWNKLVREEEEALKQQEAGAANRKKEVERAAKEMEKAAKEAAKEMEKAGKDYADMMKNADKEIRQANMNENQKKNDDLLEKYQELFEKINELRDKNLISEQDYNKAFIKLADSLSAESISLYAQVQDERMKILEEALKAEEKLRQEELDKEEKKAEEAAEYYKKLFASALAEGDGIIGKLKNVFETLTADLVSAFVQNGVTGVQQSPVVGLLQKYTSMSAGAATGLGVAGAVGGVAWNLWQQYESQKEATQNIRNKKADQRMIELINALKDAAEATSLLYYTGNVGGRTGNVGGMPSGAGTISAYGGAISVAGQISPVAMGQYAQIAQDMEYYKFMTTSWAGEARKFADMWIAAFERLKKLQVETVFKQLEAGAISFTSAMAKLESLDLDEKDLITYKYEESLKFLTNETIPALYGELSKARDVLKQTADEYENLNKAQEEADIKAKILLSDLELTESQLQALKIGEVNLELIEFYEALGWTDKELVLVSADAADAATNLETLEAAAKTVQETLKSLADLTAGMDLSGDIEEAAEQAYKLALSVEGIAKAAEKLSGVPDIIDEINRAFKEGDIPGETVAWMELADTLLYTASVLDQINKTQALTNIITQLGTAATYIYLLLEILQVFQRAAENDAFGTMLDNWISKLGELEHSFSRLIAVLELIENRRPENKAGPTDITGTTSLINPPMTLTGAAGIVNQYNQPEGYLAQMEDIRNKGEEAAALIWKNMDAMGLSVEEYLAILTTIKQGIEQDVADLQEAHDKAFGSYMQPIRDISATAGMSDIDKNLYSWDQQVQGWIDGLEGLDLSPEEYAAAMQDINNSWWAGYTDLMKQAETARKNFLEPFETTIAQAGMSPLEKQLDVLNRYYEKQREEAEKLGVSLDSLNQAYGIQRDEIINNFWDPVIQSIKDQITSLQFSSFNLAAPKARATDAQGEYDRLKAAAMGATGEDAAKAAQDYQAFVNTYLTEMKNTYMSSADYQTAYQDVMDTLGLLGDKAISEKANMSQYESESIGQMEKTVTWLEDSYNKLEEVRSQSVVSLSEYKLHQTNLTDATNRILNDGNLEIKNLGKLATDRNKILREVREVLKDIKKNTGGNNRGSGTQSESIKSRLL